MSNRTEHDALKEALPAIEAAANQRRVRRVSISSGENGVWSSGADRLWWNPDYRWEIEPEPQTRPLTDDPGRA
jgi:hypothetical protein